MSGEIVNLNKARKARAEAEAKAAAKANRAKFGRTAGQKLRETLEAARARLNVDAHHRDRPKDK